MTTHEHASDEYDDAHLTAALNSLYENDDPVPEAVLSAARRRVRSGSWISDAELARLLDEGRSPAAPCAPPGTSTCSPSRPRT